MNTTAKTDAAATSRRRRKSADVQASGRMGVDPSLLDHDRFAYRWINDKPGRMVTKTKHDDWDMVPNAGEKEDSTDMGDMVSIVVGTLPDGSPMRAYLCRKPKTYFDEDRKTAQAELDRQINELSRGKSRDGSSQSDYVPRSGISLS